MYWRTRSMAAASAPVQIPRPVPAWDSRLWLLAFPVAWVVIYASVSTQRENARFRVYVEAGMSASEWRVYGWAETAFTEALRLRPGYVEGHIILGNILYTQGKVDPAIAHFTEALRLEPAAADTHCNLGIALQSKGRLKEAEAHFAEAVRLLPGYAEAHKNLGSVLYAQGMYELAKSHFIEALRLHPGFVDARNDLGMIFYRQKRYPQARAHFAEAVRLDPQNGQTHYNVGLAFSRLGDYEAAKAECAEAIRLEPGDPKAYNASALIMAACPEAKFRDGKKAVQLATRACELTKWKNPVILDTLAAAQAEAGDFDAALKTQKGAIELLTDQRQKDEYRSRVKLYEAKKPYRESLPEGAPAQR